MTPRVGTEIECETLGQALRYLRERAGLTQEQVAERASSLKMYVSRVERGQVDVGWAMLLRLLSGVGADLRGLADALDAVHGKADNHPARGAIRRG